MNFGAVFKTLGHMLTIFSSAMLPPMIISLIYQEELTHIYLLSALGIFIAGFSLWYINRNASRDLLPREGFLVVIVSWLAFAMCASMPFYLSAYNYSFVNSFFESVSGLTTTGSTVFDDLENTPRSFLFYRSMLQWLGGMGIIVLAVAVLPFLGVGGMQLYRAEMAGPLKENKFQPHIGQVAKSLWSIYAAFTLVAIFFYWLADMTVFDAVNHGFTTIASGGFSTHDQSLGYFDNFYIELIAMVGMVIASLNFLLHYIALTRTQFGQYFRESECRFFICMLLLFSAYVIVRIYFNDYQGDAEQSIRKGLFQTIATLSSTGYTIDNFSLWQYEIPTLLIALSFFGGCAGSTCGGIKNLRIMLLLKLGYREVGRILHAHGAWYVKHNRRIVDNRVIEAIGGFVSFYFVAYTLIILALLMCGLDQTTAYSAAAAAINNFGPALGEAAQNYASLPDSAKLVLCFAMILGRLEIYSLLIFFIPAFWRA